MGAYAGTSINALRAVAQVALASSDLRVIAELKDEMQLRIKRRIDNGQRPKREQVEFLRELEQGVVAAPAERPGAPVEPEQPNEELERLRRELDLWRALYSELSETLSRWGMTRAMPLDVLDKVGEIWRKKLEAGPVDPVRTPERFESDFARARAAISKGGKK